MMDVIKKKIGALQKFLTLSLHDTKESQKFEQIRYRNILQILMSNFQVVASHKFERD